MCIYSNLVSAFLQVHFCGSPLILNLKFTSSHNTSINYLIILTHQLFV